MTEPLVLLGRAPGTHPRYEPRYALYPVPVGCTGYRLWEMTGLPTSQYIKLDRRNLLDYWPGRQGQGDKFPVRAAREAAEAMTPTLAGKRVLMMGKGVAQAFGIEDPPLLRWATRITNLVPRCSFRWAVLPHPSGRNRWYNDEENRARAEAFVRRAVQHVARGEDR